MDSIEAGISTESGAYLARVAAEVDGSPEEVWRAVATGPGTEAWFVPARIEERTGGTITTHHGEHGDSTGQVTVWDPPRRFEYVERDWLGKDESVPDWLTVITVEPVAGEAAAGDAAGRCRVTLASGFREGGTAHDADVDGTLAAWQQMFFNLRFYLANYRGQAAATVLASRQTAGAEEEQAVWQRLKASLELDGGTEGTRVTAPAEAPEFAGTVLQTGPTMIAVHLSDPVPGVLQLSANSYGDETWVSAHAYLYGPDAEATARTEQPKWEEWLRRLQ